MFSFSGFSARQFWFAFDWSVMFSQAIHLLTQRPFNDLFFIQHDKKSEPSLLSPISVNMITDTVRSLFFLQYDWWEVRRYCTSAIQIVNIYEWVFTVLRLDQSVLWSIGSGMVIGSFSIWGDSNSVSSAVNCYVRSWSLICSVRRWGRWASAYSGQPTRTSSGSIASWWSHLRISDPATTV